MKFNAISQWPAKAVTTATKPVAGASSISVSGIAGTGWSLDTGNEDWAWTPAPDASGNFAPDVQYKLAFNVVAATGTPPYGFYGLATDYFTPGNDNVASVTHNNKSTWSDAAGFNTKDRITITFPKTAAHPTTGNVVIPTPHAGLGNTLSKGDELETTIPGVKAYFYGWRDETNGVSSAQVLVPGSGPNDTIFKPESKYTAIVQLVADDAHTFYAIDDTDLFTIADSTATRRTWSSQTDLIRLYQTTFKTEKTIANTNLAVPHPIAGLTAGERNTLYVPTKTGQNVIANNMADYLESYEVLWFKTGEDTPLAADYVFEPEATYTAKTVVVPQEGYTVYGATKNKYKYAGHRKELNPNYNVASPYYYYGTGSITAKKSTYNANSDTITVDFYPTAFQITKDVIVGLKAPVAGATPPTVLPESALGQYEATVTWTTTAGEPVGATFEAGTGYLASVKVDANTRNFYTLSGLAEDFFKPEAADDAYTVVSTEPIVITDSTNYATIVYQFAKTAELITIKDIELVNTDFIYPTAGWVTPNASNPERQGIVAPKVGDVIVDNEQYSAAVNKWEAKSAVSITLMTDPVRFMRNNEYILTLKIVPKAGWTVWGLDKEIADLDPVDKFGTWATYPAGEGHLKKVMTWANNLAAGYSEVQFYFKAGLDSVVTEIKTFPSAAVATVPAKKANLASKYYTVDDLTLTGELSGEGRYMAGETYTYALKLTPKEGYTAVGLAKNKVTTSAVGTVKHAVNDLSEVEVTFQVPGKRVKEYEIVIAAPNTGYEPAKVGDVKTTEGIRATDVTWTGTFDPAGRFIKGNTYSVTVVLDDSQYSFYGVPENAFVVKDYPFPLAIPSNHANNNVVTIQFPSISNALVVTPPKFVWVTDGYTPIAPGSLKIKNNTSNGYVIDTIIVSGEEFTIAVVGSDTVKATQEITDWEVVPNSGLKKGNHTATVTVYYHMAGYPTPIYYADVWVSLDVVGVGIDGPVLSALSVQGNNGQLTIKGLTAGEPFSVHNAQGLLIYRGIAKTTEAIVPAPVKGVYIVTSGDKTLKTINR
jgi:hypothetical protein